MVIQEVSPVFMAMVREPVLGRIDIGLSVTLKMAVTHRFSPNIGAGIHVLTTTMTCVIVVSHDRYFLDRTVDRLFCFDQGRLNRFEGNYSAFLEQQRQEERSQSQASKPSTPKPESSRKTKRDGPRRRNFKENKELAALDQQLPELELKKEELEQQMTREGADMAKLSLDLAEIINRIEQAEERWLELSELAP